jgi:hypothetical protein
MAEDHSLYKSTGPSLQPHLPDLLVDPPDFHDDGPASDLTPPSFQRFVDSFESACAMDNFSAVASCLSSILAFPFGSAFAVSLLTQILFLDKLRKFVTVPDDPWEQLAVRECDQSLLELALTAIAQCISQSRSLAAQACLCGIPRAIKHSFPFFGPSARHLALEVFVALFDPPLKVCLPYVPDALFLSLGEFGHPDGGDALGGRLASLLASLRHLSTDPTEDRVFRHFLFFAFLTVLDTPLRRFWADCLRGTYCLCHLESEFLESGAVARAARRVLELSNDNETVYYAVCVARICGHECARDLLVRLWNFVRSPTAADATKVAVVELVADICFADPDAATELCTLNVFNSSEYVFTSDSVQVKEAVCMLVAVGMAVGDGIVREHLARPVFVHEMVDVVDQVRSDWAELILEAVLEAVETVKECRLDLAAHGGIKVLEQVETASPRAADLIEAILAQLTGDLRM